MRTPRTSNLPPFSSQVVGTFPRPKVVLDLLARRHEFTPDRFTQIMDDLVRYAIRVQGLAGLDVVSDGEWRRARNVDFLRRIGGFDRARTYTKNGQTLAADVVVARMSPMGSVFKAHADFLINNTARFTKFIIPGPLTTALRYWHEDHSKTPYPTQQAFMDHLVELLVKEVHALVTAGIDIIQIDEPALTYFNDPDPSPADDPHEARLRSEWNLDTQFPRALAALNRIAEPAIGKTEIHLQFNPSDYKTRPGLAPNYQPLLPRLKSAKIDRVNLEFATRGTAALSDLALLPPHIDVGLGVLDVRPTSAQSDDDIRTLALAAAKIISPARIALNPDAGFSPESGPEPTVDQAYDRLRRLALLSKSLRSHT